MVLFSASVVVFSVVGGLYINLKLPQLHWEQETYVVKQSASTFLGGFLGPMTTILGAVILLNPPGSFRLPGTLLLVILLAAVSGWMYIQCIRTNLALLSS